MNNNFGIYDNSFSEIVKEFQNFKTVEKAVIFGSRAMGNYKKGSDIDIAIFGKNITFEILSKINYKLNDELPTPYFIDVIHFETTENEELKKHILNKGKIIYQKEKYMKHYVNPKFIPENYQQCTKTVMDNIADPNITFDDKGICNYYYEYLESEKKNVFTGDEGKRKFNESIAKIKASGKGKKYDCILGVSGGVDSTYLADLLKKQNVRTLLVHFDNGWNSELAVKNIESIVNYTGFDLETFVMDWEEFKDIQRSYFKASVLDLEVPTDLMIFGAMYKIANKYNIKYVVSGNNTVTEDLLPKSFYFSKFDLTNLLNIHKRFGKVPIKKLPKLGLLQYTYYAAYKKIEGLRLLNYVPYNKDEVKEYIIKNLNWTDYGGKHYESVFTRFYQGYILPRKFGIDKRKAHLSNLIASGQLTREDALKELEKPPMPEDLAAEDKIYVAKKLGFTESEFEDILNLPNVPHEFYGTHEKFKHRYFKFMKIIKPFTRIIKKIR